MAPDIPEARDVTAAAAAAAAAHWRRVMLAVPLVFGILSLGAYLARLYVTIRVVRRAARVDDYLLGVAVVLMLGHTGCVLTEAVNGVGVPEADSPPYTRVHYNLASWLSTKFYSTSMLLAKLAIILLLRRRLLAAPASSSASPQAILRRSRSRIALEALAVLTITWGACIFLYTIWICNPVASYWDGSITPGEEAGEDAAGVGVRYCLATELRAAADAVLAWIGVATDLAVVGLWVESVQWRRRPRRRLWPLPGCRDEAAAGVVLFMGVVVCVVSALAASFIDGDATNRLSTPALLHALLALLENHLTILCASLLPLLPLLLTLPLRHSPPPIPRPHPGPEDQPRPSRDAAHTIRSWGFSKMSAAIETSVMGMGMHSSHHHHHHHVESPPRRHHGVPCERQNSSQIELKGIEVLTTIDQEVSAGRISRSRSRSRSPSPSSRSGERGYRLP
ncbi:hypothetical protein E4U41_006934 [Claviceps citrina]|nr:hypothetical protein E4U41_006934 [Claviceps citrina]